MARLLIVGSALEELRAVEPRERRRQLVLRLSMLDGTASDDRLASGGRNRLLALGLRVLYRLRADGNLVITRVQPDCNALDSGSE